MVLSEQQRIVLETNAARDRAEALLQRLLEAKSECEREMSDLRRTDVYKTVTGRSAIENAIASTRRMIDTLNHALEQAQAATSPVQMSERAAGFHAFAPSA